MTGIDRNAGLALILARDRVAVHDRQVNTHQDEIGPLLRYSCERLEEWHGALAKPTSQERNLDQTLRPSQRLYHGADILDKQLSQGGERPVFQRDDSNRHW